jgi:hypothetical protein
MPAGDTVEEDVSPEERIALAEARAAKRTVEIFWLIAILATFIFVICLCASLYASG